MTTGAPGSNGGRHDSMRRSLLAMGSAALAGMAVGALCSDTARLPGRAFDASLICRPSVLAELQARSAKRIQTRSEP